MNPVVVLIEMVNHSTFFFCKDFLELLSREEGQIVWLGLVTFLVSLCTFLVLFQ